MLADFHNQPSVVGAHRFTWQDYDTPDREANRGLVRADGRPWEELVRELQTIHDRIQRHMADKPAAKR